MHRRDLAPALTLTLLAACKTSAPVAPAPEAAPPAKAASAAPAERAETDVLTNARQLIFEGKRSGEGYFSKDGSQLIFQSERDPANPFYQIYLMDLETGDTERMSPGHGKTTCSWIHPNGDQVLFASTQDDPDARAEMKAELDFRASGKSRRYSWDYDEYYDIYSTKPGSGEYTRLTKAKGYDAEGSWSPDGKQIVFASNRRGYTDELTPEQKKTFERDPSYMIDLYIMNADGTGLKQLTKTPGYDGGPFFSPDGQRITWRRFSEDGHTAEVWTMKTDGTDQRQLTKLGHMSWAPYYHPSGDYLIFTTNVHGFHNFELYLVDVEGKKKPVRVTFTEGFDGLPVFSPDGAHLYWTTSRSKDKKAQLWAGDWNDAAARKLLALAPGRDAVSYVAPAEAVEADLSSTKPAIEAADLKQHVLRLTAQDMEGRLTGTVGEAKATAYVAEVFEKLGLSAAGVKGYFQPFEFTAGVELNGPNVLVVEADGGQPARPKVNETWRPLSLSKPGSIARTPLVFAGYGIVAKDDKGEIAYDAYGELDVKDKWVVVLRYMPENISAEKRQQLSRYASLRYKAMEARDRGAKGLIVVTGPHAKVKEELVPLRFDAAMSGSGITGISVTNDFAAKIFARAKKDLAKAQAALDGGKLVPGFDLPGTKIGGHLSLGFEKKTGRNVLARLQVGDAPTAEVVIVGAHVDHLGRGEGGSSLARPEEKGQIHYGADDNASGVGGLLEVAQWLVSMKAKGKLAKSKRDIVFAAWSGEELGLYGSTHFVNALAEDSPKKNLQGKVAAYLNMDMIGRMNKQVVLQGVASSPVWKSEIERRNVPVGLAVQLSNDTYLPTDATPFYLKGVPILAAFTGAHADYHSPRDTAERLDYGSAARIAKLIGLITKSVAEREHAPEYVKVAPPKGQGNRRVGRAYLGTIPEYAANDVKGVKLSGVSEGGPAAKAGMKGGDVLVGLAGQNLTNIYDYVKVLDGLKIGQKVKAVVLRAGKKVELEVTPTSRD